MVIVVDFGEDVQRYVHGFAHLSLPSRPACPRCGGPGHVIGHGSYGRRVAEPARVTLIRVKRLFCTVCHHTMSLLPTFCLPCRHYATATIQTVLAARHEAHASWARIGQRFLPADLPTRTTCREWVGAFAPASTRYRPALLGHLATWARRSSAIEVALTDLGEHPDPPAQLIAAVPHLLVALREAGVSVANGSERWLATLWQWGNGRKLGRVV